MRGTRTQNENRCLGKHLHAFPLTSEPREERESDKHPDLVGMRKPRFRPSASEMDAGSYPNDFELAGARGGEATDSAGVEGLLRLATPHTIGLGIAGRVDG